MEEDRSRDALLLRDLRRPGLAETYGFTRITVRPDQMGGSPCIPGLRIPVATVPGMVAEGMSYREILAARSGPARYRAST
jgi:hypothetical protein